MKRHLLVTLFCFFSLLQTRSQEVIPTYYDYLTDNLYLLHPSMAGASNMNKVRLTARQQWFDIKNAPSLQTLSIHGRPKEKVGVGFIAFNDQNGNYSKGGLYGSLAYHILFSRSEFDLQQLSFGVSGGIIQHSLDQNAFTEFDPLLKGSSSDIYANLDLGFSYYYFNFFAHLTAKNVLSIKRSLYFSDAVPANQRKYLFSTGYVFETPRKFWQYEPSILFQFKEMTKEKILDINFKVYQDLVWGRIFGGLSYRRSFDPSVAKEVPEIRKDNLHYLTGIAGFEYQNFLLAYTYSQQLNSVVISNSGHHQIILGYNFGENRGRYDCFCPGVNQRRNQ